MFQAMKPLATIDEAREAGCTHLWVACALCNKSACFLLDALERRTKLRSIQEMSKGFRCQRCGALPSQFWFATVERDPRAMAFVVAIWDDKRLEVEHITAGADSADHLTQAFHATAKKHPHRWVTLMGRFGIVMDSGRDYVGLDG